MKQILEQFLASRGAIALAMLIAMVWGFWFMPLYDLDEGAFTEATREMMETLFKVIASIRSSSTNSIGFVLLIFNSCFNSCTLF